MTDIIIPDNLPILHSGGHSEGAHELCAMEAAAWIAAEKHSDHPACVHPVIASMGRSCNDRAADAERQLLWPLILRSLGTAGGDKILSVQLAVWCARNVLPLFEAWSDSAAPRKAIEAAEAWANNPTANAAAAAAAHAAYAAVADAHAAAQAAAHAAYATYHAVNAAADAGAAAAHAAYAAVADAADAAAHAAYATANAANAAADAYTAYAAQAADAADHAAYATPSLFGLWSGLLDEFDRLTGRVSGVDPDAQAWERVLVAGGAA